MANDFFQTRVRPDQLPLTAIRTPLGIYEWTVMPMGCKNAPATHQRCMENALRLLIGKIYHVYLDDIVIPFDSIEQHQKSLRIRKISWTQSFILVNPSEPK